MVKEYIEPSKIKHNYKKVILLGMDGLDPRILSALMKKGELPNFSNLSKSGSFSSLATSNPAQSPVAWASIATGNNPGYHGVFDFIGRRAVDYMPELTIMKVNPKNMFGKRELMFLPVMHGDAFWDITSANGISSTILKWPVTFQPKQNKAKLYAGLGVPDIKGGLGKYSFYTSRQVSKNEEGIEKVIKVNINENNIKTYISGPRVAKLNSREEAKTEMAVSIFSDDSGIEINIDGNKVTVKRAAWSEWVEVKFKVGLMKTVSGIVKFYLNGIKPDFELYMSAVQINPKDPAFVITSPDEYIRELAGDLALFYTLGMSEDTKALEEGRIDEDAFIKMCDEIIDEQEEMLWSELEKFREGLFAFAFFTTDRVQHIFWSTIDPEHPLYDEGYAKKYGHVIDDYYRRMDRILGQTMEHLDDDTAFMVFSDHGFSTFRRVVHLNSWLVENGFMTLKQKVLPDDKEGGPLFKYVDWNNTKAFSTGFGSIYLNIKGREKLGIVDPAQADEIMDRISEKLLALTDTNDGKPAIMQVYKSRDIYSGHQLTSSPDMVIGFHEGFRASWQTAIGGSPSNIFDDNLKKWSGDHIMDPSIVPGILLSNFRINSDSPSLMDIAPTVLSCFGMSSQDMEGKTLMP
ncbi:MAG: alkaline phosphatase family protein [Thermodesulfovibrionia bacterium]|nr:alkaline phosphatase family protein [Thermodesulfovibrionia bacterium]